MAGLLAARSDSTGILVPRGRRTSLLHRQQENEGTELWEDGRTCGLARVFTNCSRNFSALAVVQANLFHVRGHVDSDRPRLCFPVLAWIHACANPGDCVCADPDLLLGGIRDVSRTGSEL